MRKGLYAIRDVLAGEVVGGVHVFPHDAPAVRFFSDVAGDAQTMVARHLGDHELIRLGYIDADSGEILDTSLTPILTGAALRASQEAAAQAMADQEARR